LGATTLRVPFSPCGCDDRSKLLSRYVPVRRQQQHAGKRNKKLSSRRGEAGELEKFIDLQQHTTPLTIVSRLLVLLHRLQSSDVVEIIGKIE
jgi:hypothetical protein